MKKSPISSGLYEIIPYLKDAVDEAKMFEQMQRDIESERKNRRFWKLARKRK